MTATNEAARTDPGPDLPDVVMNLHTPKSPGVGVVVENTVCTARKAAGFTRHVAIDVSGTEIAGAFRAGQSFGVTLYRRTRNAGWLMVNTDSPGLAAGSSTTTPSGPYSVGSAAPTRNDSVSSRPSVCPNLSVSAAGRVTR